MSCLTVGGSQSTTVHGHVSWFSKRERLTMRGDDFILAQLND